MTPKHDQTGQRVISSSQINHSNIIETVRSCLHSKYDTDPEPVGRLPPGIAQGELQDFPTLSEPPAVNSKIGETESTVVRASVRK